MDAVDLPTSPTGAILTAICDDEGRLRATLHQAVAGGVSTVHALHDPRCPRTGLGAFWAALYDEADARADACRMVAAHPHIFPPLDPTNETETP